MNHLDELHLEKYIILMITNTQWYFKDLIEENNVYGVVWTPYIELAHPFFDEEIVNNFRDNYLKPRKVDILRLK